MTVKEAQKKQEDKMEVDENTTLSPEELKLKALLEAFELLVADIVNDCNLVFKGVQQSDDRLIGRALRQAFHMRKQFSRQLFENVFAKVIKDSERKPILQNFLSAVPEDETKMEITEEPAAPEEAGSEKTAEQKPKKPIQYPVEVDVFLQILIIAFLIDKKLISEAVKAANDLITFVQSINRRTLSVLAAKAYFYFSRAYELNKELASIRPVLLNALRNASLRQDNQVQAMVINLLLRNYLADNLYDQANKLLTKTPTLEIKSTSQLARFLYYKGKIKSVQLDYSEAYDCLMTAIRKAPATSAKGFRVSAFKLAIIVKLLMGEIPERSVFSQPDLKTALKPYFELTKFVRIGDLLQFREVVEQYAAVYKRDKTYTLIQRIRQNVIRTGLKKISLSYSRISFQDICSKLHLDNPEDVEMIVAKAIKDGIIDATIDHEGGFVRSRETVDVYSTSEPAESYDKRIGFCLQIHDECVKALRYPPETEKKMKKELEGAEERRVSEEELAEELAEDDGEDDEF